VHPFILFFIRAVLGMAIATLITRMYRGSISAAYVAGLAIVLVGLAYVFEYFRKRKNR
jgi:putative Mn2+ efflux pump MntP